MAIAVANSKQTIGGSPVTTITITSATKGNLLVAFLSETASVLNAPKPKDNISGETGWTVNETKAVSNTSTNSLWLATKEAVGGETTIEFTPGVGATGQGISYFELSGATATVDTIVHTDNQASGKTITSPSVTTTESGDAVLAAVQMGSGGSGTISAWTGTGPMTNVSTTTTRVIGGSYIPGSTLSAVTFTANWEVARVTCLLLVAFKAAGGGAKTVEGNIAGRAGAKTTVTGAKVGTGNIAAESGIKASLSGAKVGTGNVAALAGTRAALTGARVATGNISALAGARAALSGARVATGSLAALTGSRAALTGQRAVQGAVAGLAGARGQVTGVRVATGALAGTTGARASQSASLTVLGTISGRTGAIATIVTSTRHVFEGGVSGHTGAASVLAGRLVGTGALAGRSGARGALAGARVAAGALSARSGARASIAGQRAAQGTLAGRTGAAASTTGRKIATGSVVAKTGVRAAFTIRLTVRGNIAGKTGAIGAIVTIEPPPPAALVAGPITLGEDLALVMGVDLGPTTGEAR